MNLASIDIGSNSLLLTVMSDSGQVLHDQAIVVGMGTGLGDRGAFLPERLAHARQVLSEYVATAAAHGVPAGRIHALATSGARRATNAGDFFSSLESEMGLKVRTITGEEEAQLSYLGALHQLPASPPTMVIDLGGGSTEVIVGSGQSITYRTSLEVGTVRLTEAVQPYEPGGARRLDRQLAAVLSGMVLVDKPRCAVAVAGTATTLAAMELGLTEYDAAAIHGFVFPRQRLLDWRDRLLAASPEERRALAAVSPKRADFLAAGATVIAGVLETAGLDEVCISDGGLRFGVLRQILS